MLTFAVYQAHTCSFTHDESYSYLNYPHHSFMHILSHESAYTNNHLLNSLGMKYSEILFGSSELSLRLPNLLALVLFMFYSYMLFKQSNRWFALAAFVVLISNSYLIDLFSMARGYGLSIGFMFMAIYHLIQIFIKKRKKRDIILFHVAALLAALGNFTMLLMYAGALCTYFFALLIQFKLNSKTALVAWSVNKWNLIMVVFSISILYEPVRRVMKHNSFDFGGKASFVESTVGSVINNGFYGFYFTPSTVSAIHILVLLLVTVSFVYILYRWLRSDGTSIDRSLDLIISNFLLIAICVITIVQHFILGSDYLVDRFAMFLWPIFLLNFFFFLQIFPLKPWLPNSIVILLAVMFGSRFIRTAEPQYLAEWGYDTHTKKAMQQIAIDIQSSTISKGSISVGCTWLYYPTLNFYRVTWNMDKVLPILRQDSLTTKGHVHLLVSAEQAEQMDLSDFEETARYEPYDCIVLRRINDSEQDPAAPFQDSNAD